MCPVGFCASKKVEGVPYAEPVKAKRIRNTLVSEINGKLSFKDKGIRNAVPIKQKRCL